MLTKLFNSQAKVKLIQFFLSTPNAISTPQEIAKKTRLSTRIVQTTCAQLANLGVIKKEMVTVTKGKHKKELKVVGFTIDPDFVLYQEMQALFLKSQLLFEGDLVDKMKKIGGAMLVILTGVFTGSEDANSTDLLIVGKVNRDKIAKMISIFESKLGFEINYTIMSRSEYYYRHDITDRFLYAILQGKHIKVLDKLYGRR